MSTGQPRSVRFLALKRNQIKSKISRLLGRLTVFEEKGQLPSIHEIPVFAQNINTFRGELNRVCAEFEVSDADAGERLVHDVEWANLEGLFQEATLRIIALDNALASQPVQAAVQEQHNQLIAAPGEEVNRTALSTTEARGEGGCFGSGDVPADVRTTCDSTEPVTSDDQVCAHCESTVSPPIANPECGESCTMCSDYRSNPDCFTSREEPAERNQPVTPVETNPILSSHLRLAESSLMPEMSLLEEHEVFKSKEPEAVPCEVSSYEQGGADESSDTETPKSERVDHVDGEPEADTCRPVEEVSLLATETNDDEDGPPSVGGRQVSLPEEAKQSGVAYAGLMTYGRRTVLYDGRCDVSIARSGTDCATEVRSAVEKLPVPAIFISTLKSPRLIWDPGV